MTQLRSPGREISLAEALDRVLGKGAAVTGDITIGIAGVDLVYVGLRALLASVGTLHQLKEETGSAAPSFGDGSDGAARADSPGPETTSRAFDASSRSPLFTEHASVRSGVEALEDFVHAAERANLFPERLDMEPEDVERGLTRLVLTLVDLVRDLMERQALRRLESGDLSAEQIERMGRTFILLRSRMEELKAAFGLEGEDLGISLGSIGDLLGGKDRDPDILPS